MPLETGDTTTLVEIMEDCKAAGLDDKSKDWLEDLDGASLYAKVRPRGAPQGNRQGNIMAL